MPFLSSTKTVTENTVNIARYVVSFLSSTDNAENYAAYRRMYRNILSLPLLRPAQVGTDPTQDWFRFALYVPKENEYHIVRVFFLFLAAELS